MKVDAEVLDVGTILYSIKDMKIVTCEIYNVECKINIGDTIDSIFTDISYSVRDSNSKWMISDSNIGKEYFTSKTELLKKLVDQLE